MSNQELFDDFDQVKKYISSIICFKNKERTYISKLLNYLNDKLKIAEIKETLILLIDSYCSDIEYEYSRGLRHLLNRREFEILVDIINLLIVNKKSLKNQLNIVQDLLNQCFDQKIHVDRCVDLILSINNLQSCILTDRIWSNSIIKLLNIYQISQANQILAVYPIKLTCSDNTWKEIIYSYVNVSSISLFFEKIQLKFETRTSQDEYIAFEKIFNLLIDYISDKLQTISNYSIVKEIYFTIIKKNCIQIKQDILEKFILKIVSNYSDNFNNIEEILIMSGEMITNRILEKIFSHFNKNNDVFSTFILIKLCKNNSLTVPIEYLNLESSQLKRVICFLIDNADISLTDDYLCNLSQDNKSYYTNQLRDDLKSNGEYSFVDKSDVFSKTTQKSEYEDYIIY